jgi:hypothetical protein
VRVGNGSVEPLVGGVAYLLMDKYDSTPSGFRKADHERPAASGAGPILGAGFDFCTVSASFLPHSAATGLQNSISGNFRSSLVISGNLGGRVRWPSAPLAVGRASPSASFARLRRRSPGSSVVQSENSVKPGKVLVNFVSLFDHWPPKNQKPDRFWADFIQTLKLG